MKPGSSDKPEKKAADWFVEMGRERRALRAKRVAVALLRISAFLCLVSAFASLAGYIPYAPGPSVVMIVASMAGFVTSVFESRRP